MTDHRALLGELAQLLDKGYDDAALEALREHDRALVALAEGSQAAAVALAREELAAERAAFADLAARQFWRGVCAHMAKIADRLSDEYAAVPAPTQIPESARLSEVMLLRGLECIASGYAAEADVIRAWAGEG